MFVSVYIDHRAVANIHQLSHFQSPSIVPRTTLVVQGRTILQTYPVVLLETGSQMLPV